MDQQQARQLLLRNSFRHFVQAFWSLVSNEPLVWGWHLEALCLHLQGIRDNTIDNLLVNFPPRHSKSIICSVLFPVWWALNDPAAKIVHSTHSYELTKEHASLSRRLIAGKPFQETFPGLLEMDPETNAKEFYKLTSGGSRLSLSTNTKAAGWDATLLIFDDLHDINKRESDADLKAGVDFYRSLTTRSVPGRRVPKLVVGQRVNEADVSGYVMEQPGWVKLILPAEYAGNDQPNEIGFVDERREVGQLLWPEGVNANTIAERKRDLRHSYYILYQQDITPRQGNLFSASWFRYYAEETHHYELAGVRHPKTESWKFATVDTALSTESGADFTVCGVWAIVGPHVVLVHLLRKRLDGTKITPSLLAVWEQYEPQFMAIEQEFVGKMVSDQLRQHNVVVRPFHSNEHGQKEVRSTWAQSKMEAGQVWFPKGKDWTADLEAELLSFPRGRWDDQVDVTSMACILARRYCHETTILTPEEQERQAAADRKHRLFKLMWAGLE